MERSIMCNPDRFFNIPVPAFINFHLVTVIYECDNDPYVQQYNPSSSSRGIQANESVVTDCTEIQRKFSVSVFSLATVQDIYFSVSVGRNKDDMKKPWPG